MFEGKIGGLALTQSAKRLREYVYCSDVVLGERFEGTGEEHVTGEDCGADSELGPGGHAVAAGSVTVHHIVVQLGEIMYQLD
ncbi:hypothetical protein O3I_015985 [Nocardia brasiliensis ATCC 700358]|uniref:Uncharacterized protein n=1 Tax=Nocardia brasiliensis (strain ATCC 700358 / HUJEG-1) TaxID=1133849 RepID=K0ENG2_NOCB7|nr:hypothetical protein O3I_015985 [Nocardia brasiliensis ATCC 700358]